MKLSEREKEKVLSTSKAQSIVSSRNSSRRSSRKGSMDDDDNANLKGVEEVKDEKTGIKCVQNAKTSGDDARDNDTIENDPGAFAAEQTWPTDTEIREAAQRKLSGQDEMVEMDTGANILGSF